MNRDQKLNKIVLAALFAALCYVATSIIKIPTPVTNGYVNIGDSIVLLCAWVIGGAYGAAAAGVGSALADLLAQYTTYVPGTFIIKFLMALAAYLLFTGLKKINVNGTVSYLLSALAAETIMVLGYFLYESTVLGYGFAASASIFSNMVQAGVSIVLGVVVISALESAKVLKMLKDKTE